MGRFLIFLFSTYLHSVLFGFGRIFKEFGNPSEANWPGYSELPLVKNLSFVDYKVNVLRRRFPQTVLTNSGYDLLTKLLEYNPKARITANDALKHIVSEAFFYFILHFTLMG